MRTSYLSIIILILFISSSFISEPREKEKQEINWLSITEAYELNQKEPRKIFVDVYTNWCGWCKKMDRDTFTDPEVVEMVNEKFYAVKLNAEDTSPITMAGDTTTARMIARSMGVKSYPTIVYIQEDFKTIQPVPGYQDAKRFKKTLEAILEWE